MKKILYLCAALAATPAHADTLLLDNGDKISGTIIDQSQPETLSFETSFGQIITVPWSKVGGMTDHNKNPIALPLQAAQKTQTAQTKSVVLKNTESYAENGEPQDLAALGIPALQTAAATQTLAPQKTKWSGRVNFGASLQTGNTDQNAILADTAITAEFDEKRRATLNAEYNREEDDDTLTEDNRSLDLGYDYFFKPKWFANANAGFEQDDIENLDLRTNLGAALGYQPYKHDALNLKMTLGPTYLREDFENQDTDNSLAGQWTLDYDQKIVKGALQIFHNHEIFVPSDEVDGFLLESASGLRVPIAAGLVGTGQIDFDWNNDPAPGIDEDDTQYSLKVGYEW